MTLADNAQQKTEL